MRVFTADLHIHSVLSPCGDLDMSPLRIVLEAVAKKLDFIAVTDHNHTGHCQVAREIGEELGIWVIYGVEVNTAEEVHCLAFFDTDAQLSSFQEYIDINLPLIANDLTLFGDQVIVDKEERIIREISNSLYPGISQSIDEVCQMVHELGGLFVPAHVDRRMNGLFTQLGFLPGELNPDAIEIFRNTHREDIIAGYPALEHFQLLKSSDAHFPEDVGRCTSQFKMKALNFNEFAMALKGINGRSILQE